MNISHSAVWLLLIHQLPTKPAYVRVKLWRRLQGLGAVPIKNAVHALPVSEQSREDFAWLSKEIVEAGGEAIICEARLVDGLSDAEVRALFNSAREVDYATLAEGARELRTKLEGGSLEEVRAEFKVQFMRLKDRHSRNVAIDFFGANGRETVDGLIGALERTARETPLEPNQAEEPAVPIVVNLKGRVWVTRQGVHVDRIACAWMIRRFIDRNAAFKFVLPQNYAAVPGELRFDMFDAEFTHVGDCCSFEVLLDRAGLDDPALKAIAEIVHDIDLKDEKFGRDETQGVKTLINGISADTHDDKERIARGSGIFDALYTVFARKRTLRSERGESLRSAEHEKRVKRT